MDERSKSKRMHIYIALLKQMAPEHLLATSAKLCAEILAAACDGLLNIDDTTGQAVLQVCVNIFCIVCLLSNCKDPIWESMISNCMIQIPLDQHSLNFGNLGCILVRHDLDHLWSEMELWKPDLCLGLSNLDPEPERIRHKYVDCAWAVEIFPKLFGSIHTIYSFGA